MTLPGQCTEISISAQAQATLAEFGASSEKILSSRRVTRQKFLDVESLHRRMLRDLFAEMDEDGSMTLEEVRVMVAAKFIET